MLFYFLISALLPTFWEVVSKLCYRLSTKCPIDILLFNHNLQWDSKRFWDDIIVPVYVWRSDFVGWWISLIIKVLLWNRKLLATVVFVVVIVCIFFFVWVFLRQFLQRWTSKSLAWCYTSINSCFHRVNWLEKQHGNYTV